MSTKNADGVRVLRFATQTTLARSLLVLAALLILSITYFPVKWSLANSASIRPEFVEVTDLAVRLAPDDPLTHFSRAILLEKSFDQQDIERSLREYEYAAALSPNNYIYWLELGRARDRSGNSEGALVALQMAKDLAPDYARIKWAIGNVYLRQGKIDEGFVEIKQAIQSDPSLLTPAIISAFQFFSSDPSAVRNSLGSSDEVNAVLTRLLSDAGRLEEALTAWNSIPTQKRSSEFRESGASLLQKLINAKRFRDAVRTDAILSNDVGRSVGAVTNGGFETELKTRGGSIFEWQFGDGLQPQIAPTSGQRHAGQNSLVIIFNTSNAKDFRPVSQTVAVEPMQKYQFQLFYRSELKTDAVIKFQIVDAVDNTVVAETTPLTPTAEWQERTVSFKTPASVDGVIVRLDRQNCGSVVCQVAGNLWIDDVSVKAVN